MTELDPATVQFHTIEGAVGSSMRPVLKALQGILQIWWQGSLQRSGY